MKLFSSIMIFILCLSFLEPSIKMKGVNFVSPSKKSVFSNFNSLQRIDAQWVAFNPYAFSKKQEPAVKFNYEHSWWGEKEEGVNTMLTQAKKEKLKVMLKPHVWVMGQGWCGEFDLLTEKDWKTWERDYEKYILAYALIAENHKVELLCIGTEYKIAATKRLAFWRQLITKVKKIYHGKITYAANWDNFHNIKFWDQLDYIGIDAYFPLSASKNPIKSDLDVRWKKINDLLSIYSESKNKKIIFTEYGYKSTHKSAGKQWEIEQVREDEMVNIAAQNVAYSSLYENVWNQPWFAGGFIWKWYPNDATAGGLKNSDYTPQHKPVEQIIKQYY